VVRGVKPARMAKFYSETEVRIPKQKRPLSRQTSTSESYRRIVSVYKESFQYSSP